MKKLKTIHKSEPVLAGLAALVAAAIGVFVAFGGHITDDQTKALVGIAVVAAPVVTWIRSKVAPTE